jgi:hypothetical protein
MTVWAKGPAGEAENDEFDRVQIEVGADEEDVWLVLNRKVSAVVMTREEAKQLVLQMMQEASWVGKGIIPEEILKNLRTDR